MTKLQKAFSVFRGVVLLLVAIVVIMFPEKGFAAAAIILGFSLILRGCRSIIYYFTMARLMVGGKYILYIGLIVLDMGLFTIALADLPKAYMILYLLGVYAVSGLIDILRGLEAKRLDAPWKMIVIQGALNISIAIVCCIFTQYNMIIIYAYALGLISTAAMHIVQAFRRNAIVYIQ